VKVYLLWVNGLLADVYEDEKKAHAAMAAMYKEHGRKYDYYITNREVKE
jgi:hypothetical protein